MSKQTQFHVYVDGGSVTISGSVTIAFPTTVIAQTENVNNVSALAAGDQIVLAANTNRRFAQIVNLSGTTQHIAFGTVASANSLPIPTGGTYIIDVTTIGQAFLGAVHVYSAAGGVNINILELV